MAVIANLTVNHTVVCDCGRVDVTESDWHDGAMQTDAGDGINWDALADIVRTARVDRGLSKEEAARRATVSSITWKRVEDGKRVQDAKLGLILRSLELTLRVNMDGTVRVFGGPPDVSHAMSTEASEQLDPETAAARLREIAEQNIEDLQAETRRDAARLASTDPERAARMLRDVSAIAIELRSAVEQAIAEGIVSHLHNEEAADLPLAADEDDVTIEREQEEPDTP